jgi:hypothetical protein
MAVCGLQRVAWIKRSGIQVCLNSFPGEPGQVALFGAEINADQGHWLPFIALVIALALDLRQRLLPVSLSSGSAKHG